LGKKDDEGNRKQRGNNSGNVFTLATDSSYIAQTWDNNRVYSLDDDPKYPGKKYTHQASDKVTNFGLNRFISPADIIRYSLLLYYKDMKSKGVPIETPNLGIEDFDT